MQQWEQDFRKFLADHDLICGWVTEQTNKICYFLNRNYRILDINTTLYNKEYVQGLNNEITELRKQLEDMHKNYVPASPLLNKQQEAQVSDTTMPNSSNTVDNKI